MAAARRGTRASGIVIWTVATGGSFGVVG